MTLTVRRQQERRKAELRAAMEAARATTLRLLERVPDDFLKRRVHDFYSPIGWHFGHIGMTEESWVCTQAADRPCLDDRLSFLFANLPENPKDGRVFLPSRDEIGAYLAATRRSALATLEEADLDSPHPLLADGYACEFARQHECQHQETIAELLYLIQKERLSAEREPPDVAPLAAGQAPTPETEMVAIPGGVFRMGSDDRHGYDNEKRAHEVAVPSFRLDRTPVTVAQWLSFIEEGGYGNYRWWEEEGFYHWRVRENITCPEYWRRASEGGYYAVSPDGLRAMHPEEPVFGISWYEADAYARWAGKRLPTEAEWEFAAAFEPRARRARRYPAGDAPPQPHQADFGLSAGFPCPVGVHPEGASAWGVLDMAGGVWEWTASPFLPYPGFEAFPYDGYSKEHMDGRHYVCRGGSFATAAPILRCSFRNWYVPTYRQGFLGLRLAADGPAS
uniref:Serine/threonine kinase n=1 Tax=uncultured Armatimonadetes bacterium TaxID=157466 RepID=A0A6J4H3G5_9BACT|nr:hypothetical protein AVDCRST_MAG63-177 [uncultured Armatimonadetes bacterium]